MCLSKKLFFSSKGEGILNIWGVWKGIVVCNFLLVPNYYQFMWKSQVIWSLWKTYWFLKQLKSSCRDIKPGNTPEGCDFIVWEVTRGWVIWWIRCRAELGICLGPSSASSMLSPVDLVSSIWQASSAISGNRNMGARVVTNIFTALSCFLAGCDTPTTSKRPDSC